LGLVLLAPSVAVILGFHLFLSGQYLWGPFVAAWFALLAWRYRRRFAPLWSRSSEGLARPATGRRWLAERRMPDTSA
jgi:hypothetical protein